jgi:2,4-dienoyl-CoA reductase-like NADH-dependent reductase (Old Yellow Enzyme family)
VRSVIFGVIVIGGGPAGMMAAIVAAESGRTVCIVDRNAALGMKLRATGGQFTNRKMGPERYHDDGEFAWVACEAFGPEDVLEFFRTLGVELTPQAVSESSAVLGGSPADVTDALEKRLGELGVDVRPSTDVVSLDPPDGAAGAFAVSTARGESIHGGKVVVAVGGRGYPQLGADQTGIRFIADLGHAVIPQYAASTRSRRAITHVSSTDAGWENVVITGGGVSVGEVDPLTMESRLIPGLYFAGEALDIQGDRGGYNLHFAFGSGRLAGRTQHGESPHPHLFSPARIGGLRLKNRVVMPAMATGFGLVSPRGRHYLGLRAGAEVGLMIWGQVSLGFLEDATDLAEAAALVESVHAAGAKIGIQLTATGYDVRALARGLPDELCSVDALPEDALAEVTIKYAAAAVRARCAGFDVIELHGAHSSLLARFASPRTNHRTDAYGGTPASRRRLPVEVVRAVTCALGPEATVAFRLNAEEITENGATIDDSIALARSVVAAGVALIDVSKCGSNGDKSGEGLICPPPDAPEGTHFELASRIRQAAGVPVIGVGRVQNPAFADAAVRDGAVDLVAVGRGLLADPLWAAKAQAGRSGEIVECLACNNCLDRLLSGHAITCPQNPRLTLKS